MVPLVCDVFTSDIDLEELFYDVTSHLCLQENILVSSGVVDDHRSGSLALQLWDYLEYVLVTTQIDFKKFIVVHKVLSLHFEVLLGRVVSCYFLGPIEVKNAQFLRL